MIAQSGGKLLGIAPGTVSSSETVEHFLILERKPNSGARVDSEVIGVRPEKTPCDATGGCHGTWRSRLHIKTTQ